MGKVRPGNNADKKYSNGRDTIPYNRESPFFQAEGDDLGDLESFLELFDGNDGEFTFNKYWSDDDTAEQWENVEGISGEEAAGYLREFLDEFHDQDFGYNVSVYDCEDDGFEVTAGVSREFPRTFAQRLGRFSPEVNHSDGGLTVRGNLDVTPQELYDSTKVADPDETRLWARVDAALSRPFRTGMR